MSSPRIAGVVLAAGASRRLGSSKQLLIDPQSGLTMVARAAQQLLDAGCAPVLVITGADAKQVEAALGSMNVQTQFNPAWEEGMGASIAAAIGRLMTLNQANEDVDLKAVLLVACDMPAVSVEHLRELLAESASGTTRVVSRYEGASGEQVVGIPALFPTSDWQNLTELSGDKGARDLLRLHDTLSVFLRAGDFDLDTAADVNRWREEAR